MSEKIVQLNEEVIKGQLKELVWGSIEETLNKMLEAEAEKLTQAARYERNEARQGYAAATMTAILRRPLVDITLHMPRLKGVSFETAIIDQQTFDLVQKIRSNVRRYPNRWGEAAPLTGLLYCADCGGKMYVHRVNNGKRISQYTCSQYSKIPCGTLCSTQHRINENVILTLIFDTLRTIAEYSKHESAQYRKHRQNSKLRTSGRSENALQRQKKGRRSWKSWCVKFTRTMSLASYLMPGMRLWMHSTPKNRMP